MNTTTQPDIHDLPIIEGLLGALETQHPDLARLHQLALQMEENPSLLGQTVGTRLKAHATLLGMPPQDQAERQTWYIQKRAEATKRAVVLGRRAPTSMWRTQGTSKEAAERMVLGDLLVHLMAIDQVMGNNGVQAVRSSTDRESLESTHATVAPGAYIVAGSVSAWGKLIRSDQLKADTVSFSIGTGSNRQEAGDMLVAEGDTLRKLAPNERLNQVRLQFGNFVAVPHGVSYVAELAEGNYEYHLTVGNGSFLGINSIYGNRVVVGENVNCGFNVQVGKNATIGAGCVLGHGCRIADGVTIPDHTLIPDNAFITPETLVHRVPIQKYIDNRDHYDTTYVHGNHRTFVIEIPQERTIRMQTLNALHKNYAGLHDFSAAHVLLENMIFREVDTSLMFIQEHLGIDVLRTYEYSHPFLNQPETVKSLAQEFGTDEETLRGSMQKCRLVAQAEPIDPEKFLADTMHTVYKYVQNPNKTEAEREKLITEVLKELQTPQIPSNYQEIFIGDENILSGNVQVGNHQMPNQVENDIYIWGLQARADECSESEKIDIHGKTRLKKCIIHGGGNKMIRDVRAENSTLHGAFAANDCHLGHSSRASTFNNASLTSVIANEGGVMVNGAKVEHSILRANVVLSGGSGEDMIRLRGVDLGAGSRVRPGGKWLNTEAENDGYMKISGANVSIGRSGTTSG